MNAFNFVFQQIADPAAIIAIVLIQTISADLKLANAITENWSKKTGFRDSPPFTASDNSQSFSFEVLRNIICAQELLMTA